jgi:hypothetical protein
MTTIKEQLLAALETTPEPILAEILNYLKSREKSFAPQQHSFPIQDGEPILRGSKAKDLLKFAGTWQGEGFEECLKTFYDTRSPAEF